MINLAFEKDENLSPQNIYDIVADALDLAEDDGFLNSYVFERALYIFTARALYTDIADDINSSLLEDGSPLITWQKLIENETIDTMLAEHGTLLDTIAEVGDRWFEEYNEYLLSTRSLVPLVEKLTSGMADSLGKQVDALQNGGLQDIQKFAQEWGMQPINIKGDVSIPVANK
jgi:hypothetical protein